jgi:cysteine desulfurase/selenocysteine lyase
MNPDSPEGADLVRSITQRTNEPALDKAIGQDDSSISHHYQPDSHQTISPSGPDMDHIRRDFPILQRKINGKPLIWFDNGATTQKPQQVIDTLSHFYRHYNSNIHRGAHTLATEATDAYEQARETVRSFIGAGDTREIIFVRGTTEAINLVAQAWGRTNIGVGDEIILSLLEHHANIVPWQMLADAKGAKLRVIPVDDIGELGIDQYAGLFTPRTKMVAFTHASNALGTVPPVQQMIQIAHSHGVPVLVDGAQSVAHMPVNVQHLDVDFYVFSGHKIFGPSGVGVLYGKREHLEQMPPWQGGGSMIRDVTFEQTIYSDIPEKFEAGTPVIGPAIGLGAALKYLMGIGMPRIETHERSLTVYAMQRLQEIPGLRLIGRSPDKIGVSSFVIDGVSLEYIGKILDQHGIAVRVGHHCAQPILRRFGVEQTVRSSLALYNTQKEIDYMIDVLKMLIR